MYIVFPPIWFSIMAIKYSLKILQFSSTERWGLMTLTLNLGGPMTSWTNTIQQKQYYVTFDIFKCPCLQMPSVRVHLLDHLFIVTCASSTPTLTVLSALLIIFIKPVKIWNYLLIYLFSAVSIYFHVSSKSSRSYLQFTSLF